MEKLITLQWEISDTRENHFGYRTGISRLQVKAKNNIEAINEAIRFADNLPSFELERNGIDEKEYKDEVYCCYHYQTKLSKIIKIENIK